MAGKSFNALICGGLVALAPSAGAFELYSWTVAESFCELRSYGMERKQAVTTAAELTFSRNPFMRVEFLQDSAVTIKDKETLAVARIRRQAERRCPGLARRSKEEQTPAPPAAEAKPEPSASP